jgi:hypothetical protein
MPKLLEDQIIDLLRENPGFLVLDLAEALEIPLGLAAETCKKLILEERINPLLLAQTDLRLAFLSGAKWWEHYKTKATMWQSDQNLVWEEALKRYPEE